MGLVFEKVCMDYLKKKNAEGALPFLFTDIGRWWGTDPIAKKQTEIDILAGDGESYLISECKWKNEKLNLQTLHALQQKSEIWKGDDEKKWLILFSKSGFTEDVLAEAEKNKNILTVDLAELMR